MTYSVRRATAFFVGLTALTLVQAEPAISQYNEVWNSPSQDENGSMPLGNGSTGLNAWIEPNGDLVFYISRTDSWGDSGRLLKLGRVRITLDPAPDTGDFLQTLELGDGMLKARCGDTDIRLWVDANHPVIHAEFSGAKPSQATAKVELWRTKRESFPCGWECSDVYLKNTMGKGVIMEPDTVLQNQQGRIGWYHRNIKSEGPAMHAKIQGVADFKREDPLLHRTFGVIIKADNATRMDDLSLLSPESKTHRFDLYVHAKHPATEAEWLGEMEQIIATVNKTDIETRCAEHVAWWRAFWNRSWIRASNRVNVAQNQSSSLVPSNDLNLRMGISSKGGNQLNGQFGRVSMIKRALRPPEIKNLASSQSETLSGVTANDVLYSAVPDLYSELKNSAQWTDNVALTLEAWISVDTAKDGRIFDKVIPGNNAGLLLDTYPGDGLRLILGRRVYCVPGVLKQKTWHHVAVAIDAASERAELYLDGERIAGESRDAVADDAFLVSRKYALQRYMNACAGRGAYPIKFNGSIFTVDSTECVGPKEGWTKRGPDYRRWGPGYWWQNTRLPYISMCTSGDFEMTDALYKMYCQDLFAYHKHRTRKHTGHGGLYVPECIYFWGDMFAETYGWTPFEEREDKLQENPYHKWEWVSGLEITFMMLDRYEHTLEEDFLQETILPFANEVITFFVEHYKTDAKGRLVMHPSQALETWWECTNPTPEVAGLHAVTDRLMQLPENLTTPEMRAFWAMAKKAYPDLPTREQNGVKMFAPAEKFAMCRNGEVPELYGVHPFKLCTFATPNVELGLNALKYRRARGNNGWRQDEIFMAYLGQTEEARKNLVGRAGEHHNNSRFPAFWGPNMDWVPDQDHGGVLLKAFQSMLLQTQGKKIYLQPAWPQDWNVDFKLHAPYKTVVEGRIENGKVVNLKVTPESRLKDVVFMGKGDGRGPAAVDHADRTGMTATLKSYVKQFNAEDKAAESNAISNDETLSFLNKNIPLFECPDKEIERTYYYRWWTFRKHIKATPDGYVLTEFFPEVGWAKKHNTINGDLGYHLYEGRWVHDYKFLDDYMRFYFEKNEDGSFGKGVDAGGKRKNYSSWVTDGVYARFLVAANPEFTVSLLDGLVDNYESWSIDKDKEWSRSRLLESGPYQGLYWQVDSWGAQENSIGGNGMRPGINSYLYGGAVAMSRIAELAGNRELATTYATKARRLRQLVQEHLWDDEAKFFKTRRTIKPLGSQYGNRKKEKCEPGALVSVRELFGYVPWLFNLPEAGKGYEEAWKQLTDRQGFWGEYGPTTAERRHPGFGVPGGCQWHGASWPYSTSQILTGLANLLNNQDQDAVGKQEYFDTLKAYTRSHAWKLQDGTTVPWIDESVNPDTGKWITHGNYPETRGRFYFHSSYCDLVISGLVGLRPRADDVVEVNPLLPDNTWDWFRLDNVLYHGRILTIIWDKIGAKYGKGKGLTVFVDGKKVAQSTTLSRVSSKLK